MMNKDKLVIGGQEFQSRFPMGQQSAQALARQAYKMFCKRYDWAQAVRALSVRAIALHPVEQPVQLDLFMDLTKLKNQDRIDKTVDDIRLRYGNLSLRNAALLQDIKMPLNKPEVMLPDGGFFRKT